MYDTNLVDFYARVATFEKSQAKGYGHEAPGTLGRSVTYGLRKTRRRISVMPLVFVVLAAVGLKARILHSVGGAAYETRVAALEAGQGFDRLGGWLMRVDPVTAFVVEKIDAATTAIRG